MLFLERTKGKMVRVWGKKIDGGVLGFSLKSPEFGDWLGSPFTSGLLRAAWLINFNEIQKSDFYPVPLRPRIGSIKTEAVAEAAVLKDIVSQPCLVNDEKHEQKEIILWFQNKTKEKRKQTRGTEDS